MRKVINGLLYDTEISELIYSEDNERFLYKTKNGNFFAMYRNGEIFSRSESQVKEYLGEKDVDKYIEIFGKPEDA